MSSVWTRQRTAKDGRIRHLVEYRIAGRGSKVQHGGSFASKRLAMLRVAAIDRDLAELRAPDLSLAVVESALRPTFAEAADAWRATRVDVTDGTRALHRIALARALPTLGHLRVDGVTVDHLVELVTALAGADKRRETIRKTIKYTAAVLDDQHIDPNPARDRRIRLPHEEQDELVPPTAEHVEAVYRRLPTVHRLPLLWLDWSGARVASVDLTLIGDYDEPQRRIRLRRSATKTRAALWVELPDVLADAVESTLPHRRFRDPEARLFADSGSDALRTAIAKACKAAGVPVFSPHDLRHRRISLLHRNGRSWAEIARFVGQRKLSITADTYTHVLVDGREVDYQALLALP